MEGNSHVTRVLYRKAACRYVVSSYCTCRWHIGICSIVLRLARTDRSGCCAQQMASSVQLILPHSGSNSHPFRGRGRPKEIGIKGYRRQMRGAGVGWGRELNRYLSTGLTQAGAVSAPPERYREETPGWIPTHCSEADMGAGIWRCR